MQFQAPLALTVAVQTGKPFSVISITLPGSAVPEITGVLLLVVLPAVGVLIAGAIGAVLSTVTLIGLLTGLVLPAGSVTIAVRVCGPFVNGVLGVQIQTPLASATAVQIVVGPSLIVTVLLGSAVPDSVGVVSLSTWPGAGAPTVGASGKLPSTVIGRVATALVLPAGSVAVKVKACGPSPKA